MQTLHGSVTRPLVSKSCAAMRINCTALYFSALHCSVSQCNAGQSNSLHFDELQNCSKRTWQCTDSSAVKTATRCLVSELLTEHGKVAQPLIYEFAGDS